jgi:hypothetical protein
MGQTSVCVLDPPRLEPFRECMTDFRKPQPRPHEWANVSISPKAVAYSCGMIARQGDPVDHNHDPDDLTTCRRISTEAARLMEGICIGMCSTGSDYFHPFFSPASLGAPVPAEVDEVVIRRAFGGALYPGPEMEIVVEPLEMRGEWWTRIREYLVDNDDALTDREAMADGRRELRRWAKMVEWFGQSGLHGCRFVMTRARHSPPEGDWFCIHFPYLAVGLTDAGSLAGIWGQVSV